MTDGAKIGAAWISAILVLVANLFGIGYFARGLQAKDDLIETAIRQHGQTIARLDEQQGKSAEAIWSVSRMAADIQELKIQVKEIGKAVQR